MDVTIYSHRSSALFQNPFCSFHTWKCWTSGYLRYIASKHNYVFYCQNTERMFLPAALKQWKGNWWCLRNHKKTTKEFFSQSEALELELKKPCEHYKLYGILAIKMQHKISDLLDNCLNNLHYFDSEWWEIRQRSTVHLSATFPARLAKSV